MKLVTPADNDSFNLTAWLDPEVPGPLPGPSDHTSIFSAFDTIGAWDCALSRFPTVTDIPRPFRSKWAEIYDRVLQSWERAVVNNNSDEITRALKVLLALPQLLLRQTGRGGKRGQAGPSLAVHFDLAIEGEWETLINIWNSDLQRLKDKESRQLPGSRKDVDDNELHKDVLRKLSAGQVSRAAGRINSFGLANLNNETTRAALQQKFPPRRCPLPTSVPRGQCVEGLGLVLRDAMLQIERGTASGPGGGRGEFLTVLAQQWSDSQLDRFKNFLMAFLHGETPPWFAKVMGAITTVAQFKTEEKVDDKVRPIGVLNKIVRLSS